MLAARAAEMDGGGSPVWSGERLNDGEELALAVEVARAVRDHRWPPLNPYAHTSSH